VLHNVERICAHLEAGAGFPATAPPDLRHRGRPAPSMTAKRAPLRWLLDVVRCAANVPAVVPFVLRSGPLLGAAADDAHLLDEIVE
jgi:hypothetical protein